MNDITRQELEVWKLYAKPEPPPPEPIPPYRVVFMHASLDPITEMPDYEASLGNRAPTRPRFEPTQLEVHLETMWPPIRGIPRGVNAFSLENRSKALAILLDVPEHLIEGHDYRECWR